jgi:hypothetical protein
MTKPSEPSKAEPHQASRTWPDHLWRPYSDASPFNWEVPGDALTLPNSAQIVESLIRLSGCDASHVSNCAPSNWGAHQDGRSGSGWPTYWITESDPDITVTCTGSAHCVMGKEFTLKMPEGAVRQLGSDDRHLTIIDADGVTGLRQPGLEYDFYQFDPEVIPGTGGTAKTVNMAVVDLTGIGQQGIINGVPGNTNAAGFGNLAGRVRAEELAAGEIRHALTIAVPCTRNAYVWPANHKGFDEKGPCAADDPNWPAMGQLFHLRMTPDEIDADPATSTAAPWAKTLLKAMATYGMYVNDNGGYGSNYFQIQSESQVQYTSLRQPDPWLALAQKHKWTAWPPDAAEAMLVGKLQGEPPPEPKRAQWISDWQTVWRRLVVIDPQAIPGSV